MPTVPRMILTLLLAAIAAFCCFGFLASYEPPGSVGARVIYGTAALACAAGVFTLWRQGPGPGSEPRRGVGR